MGSGPVVLLTGAVTDKPALDPKLYDNRQLDLCLPPSEGVAVRETRQDVGDRPADDEEEACLAARRWGDVINRFMHEQVEARKESAG